MTLRVTTHDHTESTIRVALTGYMYAVVVSLAATPPVQLGDALDRGNYTFRLANAEVRARLLYLDLANLSFSSVVVDSADFTHSPTVTIRRVAVRGPDAVILLRHCTFGSADVGVADVAVLDGATLAVQDSSFVNTLNDALPLALTAVRFDQAARFVLRGCLVRVSRAFSRNAMTIHIAGGSAFGANAALCVVNNTVWWVPPGSRSHPNAGLVVDASTAFNATSSVLVVARNVFDAPRVHAIRFGSADKVPLVGTAAFVQNVFAKETSARVAAGQTFAAAFNTLGAAETLISGDGKASPPLPPDASLRTERCNYPQPGPPNATALAVGVVDASYGVTLQACGAADVPPPLPPVCDAEVVAPPPYEHSAIPPRPRLAAVPSCDAWQPGRHAAPTATVTRSLSATPPVPSPIATEQRTATARDASAAPIDTPPPSSSAAGTATDPPATRSLRHATAGPSRTVPAQRPTAGPDRTATARRRTATASLPAAQAAPARAASNDDPAAVDPRGSAQAVMATTGIASSAAAGVLSPTAANKANTAGRLVAMLRCGQTSADDDDDNVGDPPWHQYILPIAVGSDEAFAKAVGALLSSAVGVVAGAVLCAVVALRLPADKRKWRGHTGILFAVLLNFYGPNIVALAAGVLAAGAPAMPSVVAFVAAALVVAVAAATTARIATMPPLIAERVHGYLGTYDRSEAAAAAAAAPTAAEAAHPAIGLCWSLAPMVESGRLAAPLLVRLHVCEDLAAAIVMAVFGGLAEAHVACVPMAFATLLVGIAHAGYVVAARPYLDRLEQTFAAALALLQAALAGAVAVAAVRPNAARPAVVAAGWIATLLNVAFYAQLGVLAVWELRRLYKRRLAAAARSASSAARAGPQLQRASADAEEDAMTGAHTTPLLEVPSQQHPNANPLDGRIDPARAL